MPAPLSPTSSLRDAQAAAPPGYDVVEAPFDGENGSSYAFVAPAQPKPPSEEPFLDDADRDEIEAETESTLLDLEAHANETYYHLDGEAE
jgi:hypothetical protein